VGVAPHVAGADPLTTLAEAEAACRAAKRHGRNRVERFAPGGDTTVVAEVGAAMIAAAEADSVRHILEGNRLGLHAQLIAPLPGNAAPTPHFELLLRVQDEQGEPVGPGRFLADAARLGLLSAVDRWVVRETLAMLGPREQLLRGGAVVLTVNLSGQSLGEAGFADELLAGIQGSSVDPRALCFEFSEAAVIEHLPAADALMRRLRDLGCHVALDDFGTGMASLASLRSMPLTMLKIDGSFVRELLKDPRAEGLVTGMINLAKSAGLATVAECVETDEIRLRLASLGVDYGQGFAIARPVPLADAIRDLPTWASVARQRHGGDIELGDEDDTVSAALQKELQRELLARGLDPQALVDEELEAAMLRLMEDSAATLAPPSTEAGQDGMLFPQQAAS
jgi:EAL domain-containing protein (putative c-di-GMP-specific phosphodiesterase class I)